MNLQKIQEKRKGISPIIATLLLILIAIAAGVIVYAYVIGFIGNSTTNSGGSTSVISVDNFCAAKTTNNCGTGNQYSVIVRNVGTVAITITSGTVEPALYFTDVTSGAAGTATCTSGSVVLNPGQTYTCAGTWPAGFSTNAGDSISLKVIDPDSGASTGSTKSLG